MLRLMDKHAIIKLKRQGYSNRKVAEILSINRKTVAKYWNEFTDNMKDIKKLDKDIDILQDKALDEPTYDSSNRTARKYTAEIDSLVDEILDNEVTKSMELGFHKQKLTYYQIYELVKEKGFDIGLTTISNKVKLKRSTVKECFIRQDYDYGDRLEYDFGEVKLLIDGIFSKYYLAVLSSPSINFRYAYLYKNQKQEVFLDSHIKFFEIIGGVHREIVYDNMRNVVSKFIGKNEKQLNPNLVKLATYYNFNINTTNCYKGNEKGHVEGSVKYIRNKVFALKYRFNSYEEACEYLALKLEEINKNNLIEEEKKYLNKAMPPYEISKLTEQKVNSYSFVKVDNNSYSVPDYLVGRIVNVRTSIDKINIYSNNKLVHTHKRKDGKNEISIDIKHYLNTFKNKPGAVLNSLALKNVPELKTIFDIYFTLKPKKFVDILIQNKDKELDEIIKILRNMVKSSSKPDKSPKQSQVDLKTMKLLKKYADLTIGGIIQ